jgi:hypothetical protein
MPNFDVPGSIMVNIEAKFNILDLMVNMVQELIVS